MKADQNAAVKYLQDDELLSLENMEKVPGTFLMRLRRPDGSTHILRVPNENYKRIVALMSGKDGDKSIEGVSEPA